MALAKTHPLLVFAPQDDARDEIRRLARALPVDHEEVHSFEEFKGRLEGARHPFVLMDATSVGDRLLECLGEPDPESLLSLSLAELEKRHILRVLASSRGNKTAAARVLGIDTKTLYNKLKGYQVSQKTQQVRKDLDAASETSGAVDAPSEDRRSEGGESS